MRASSLLRFVITVVFAAAGMSCSSRGDHEKEAISILERMVDRIGQLDTASFTVFVTEDVDRPDFGPLQRNRQSDVYLAGSNTMHVYAVGDSGRAGLWYDGESLTIYSFTRNLYSTVPAPPTTLETIDSIHRAFGVDFPAADFFYPSLVEDVQANNSSLRYVGRAVIDGEPCDHLMAKGNDNVKQVWISQATYLPVRLLINGSGGARYEATITNWRPNTSLPPSIFTFTVPDGAKKIPINTLWEGA